jgi:hypothetical protein
MDKVTPKIPDNVAKEYDCLVTPGVVIIQNPKNKLKKQTIDLTKVTMKQAKELAEAGRYFVKKGAKLPEAKKE